MHLLVLSAFRLYNKGRVEMFALPGLNAPFGAQCFPTSYYANPPSAGGAGLNAPFGAQCFPTEGRLLGGRDERGVSMHLLVLSAFRQRKERR